MTEFGLVRFASAERPIVMQSVKMRFVFCFNKTVEKRSDLFVACSVRGEEIPSAAEFEFRRHGARGRPKRFGLFTSKRAASPAPVSDFGDLCK